MVFGQPDTMLIFAFLISTGLCLSTSIAQQKCFDHKGRTVPHGESYFPLESDPCTRCSCTDGKPEMCLSASCSPPGYCRQYHVLNEKCCEFVCLDGNIPHIPPIGVNITDGPQDGAGVLATTNLGLRLVASAVTSFLILALLLFMIHRLRQRRLLLVIRRLNGDRMDTTTANSRQFGNDDDSNVGYFVGHDHLDFGAYDEPPPPYNFWKPPETYIPTGEAPPPYEMTIRYPPPAIVLSPSATPMQQECLFPRPDHSFGSRSPLSSLQTHLSIGDRSTDGRGSFNSSNISPGVMSLQDQSDNSSSFQGAISADVRYEDVPFPSNVTILHLNSFNSTPSVLCEADIANGNVLTTAASLQNACSTSAGSSLDRDETRTKSQEARPGNRCHSYCEGLGQWRAEQTNQKPILVRGSNNNVFPDPTAWAGENSESSSSTSPSSDLQSGSQSSTDSSPDAEFLHKKEQKSERNTVFNSNESTQLMGATGCIRKTSKIQTVKDKRNSLERTIRQLKKFSIPLKKNKTGYTAGTSTVSVKTKTTPTKNESLFGCRTNLTVSASSESSCSSRESPKVEENIISPCIENEIRPHVRCKHYKHRPASLNLNSWYVTNPETQPSANENCKKTNPKSTSSESSFPCSSGSSADSVPPDLAATHSSARKVKSSAKYSFSEKAESASSNRSMAHRPSRQSLSTASETISPDNLQHQIQLRSIARSSSICSETGEHNPRRLNVSTTRVSSRHSSDSTPDYIRNINSPSQAYVRPEQTGLDNLKLPFERYRRSCSSDSTNSGL